MKRILYSICIGSLALTLTAWGEQNNGEPKAKTHRKAGQVQKQPAGATTTAVNRTGQIKAQHNGTNARFRQRTVTPQATTSNVVVRENNLRNRHMQTFRDRSVRNTNEVRARNDLTVNRERNLSVNRTRNVTVNRQRNVTITNNWRGERFSGRQYAAFRNYHREWHDRDWWTGHHSRIVFVFGGPYYWNAGYWYPAWGYNPGYSYPYDGPIYGYNNLAPDQVVVNVQSQLQRDGYYNGPIDGVLGPMTRQAIAAFQADHGLAVTSAVDEPTLATLGLV